MKTLHEMAARPSKSKAFRMIEDSFYTGEQLTDRQLSELLLYFAPPKKKTPRNAIDFVRLAVAANDMRFCLNYIKVEGGIATGCDGNRMYQAHVDLPDGAYCPKTLAPIDPKTAGNYPDVERIKPELKSGTRITLNDMHKVPQYNGVKGVTLIDGWPFNSEYIQPAVDYLGAGDVYLIPQGNSVTLVLKSDGAYALIMGIKKK